MTMHTMSAVADVNDVDRPSEGMDPAYMAFRRSLLAKAGKTFQPPMSDSSAIADRNNKIAWLQLRQNHEIEKPVEGEECEWGPYLMFRAYDQLGTNLEFEEELEYSRR